ncbi:DEAD/DEAH box helicase family protein [Clostridioides difficile]|uniref:DEAD/DEAH box helicase family protein n=1 Tax=Clostridioides difficile TaxID=1496 RepID=UPI000D1E219D|nr:DEAD/DEAH box helicase family protein [Clostridioides difficile]
MNQSYHNIKNELLSKQLAYIDRLTGYLVDRDNYLSGYVKEKLKIAKEASIKDNTFLVNVKALEANQPKYETDVFFSIDSTWISSSIKSDFIEKTLELKENSIQLLYSTQLGYSVKCSDIIPISKNEFTWGTKRRKSLYIVEAELNMKTITVTDKEYQNGKEVSVKNLEETQLAMNILNKWLIAFHNYVTSNSYIHKELLDRYNEMFIDYKEKEYKNILNDVRINPNIKLREHQLKAASRIITSDRNTLLCHSVGSGKTYTMITAAQELNRISKIDSKKGNKNLFVIPNSLCESGQFAKEYFNLYPQANILATTSKDFSKSNRRKIIAKIVTCNWDSIIIPHSVLGLIPLEADTELKLLDLYLKELNDTLKYYKKECPDLSTKRLETMKENYLNRIKELNDMHKDDALLSFEKLGITNLFIDEAHNFKNLYFNTTMQVPGISTLKTKKTQDLYNKLRYFKSIHGNKGVTFATATPISNSICEMYTLLTYLNKDTLKYYKVDTFNAWASKFGSIISSMEVDPTGQGFRFQQRFAKFCNVPELVNIFRQIADVVNICDINDLDIPQIKGGKPIIEIIKPTNQMKEYIDSLVKRAEKIHEGPYDPIIDNMLNVTTDGRLMAVSPALVGIDGILPKIIKVGENIASLYHEDKISTHLVFCDLGTPNGNSHNVYNDIKNELLKNNVLEKDIAYIHDANTSEKRKKLIDDFNNGIIRILIGSTSKITSSCRCSLETFINFTKRR